MNPLRSKFSQLAMLLCFLIPVAVISAQEIPGGGGPGDSGSAAKCPDQLMFEHFGAYYYSVKECPNTVFDMLYGYTEQVQTGCKAGDNSKCNTSLVPYASVPVQKSTGTPIPVPPNLGQVLVIPAAEVAAAIAADVESTVNGSGSYKSTVRVAGELGQDDRYFLVISFVYPNSDRANFARELGAPVAGCQAATIDFSGNSVSHAGLLFPVLRELESVKN